MKPTRRMSRLTGGLLVLLMVVFLVPPAVYGKPCRIHLLTGEEYFTALRDAIDGAKLSVYVAIYLFKTDRHPTNHATGILNALLKAARRGVEVTVLMEHSDDPESFINRENEKTGQRLLKAGAKVYLDRPDRKLHIKAVIIDHHLVFMGSHNLTHSAMKYNQEMSLEVNDGDLANRIIKQLSRFPKTLLRQKS